MTKEIKLTRGQVTLIDDEDVAKLDRFKWQAFWSGRAWYAKSTPGYLHRIIMGVSNPRIQVDHIDGNGLNNQRSNLRIATNQQNQFNRKKSLGNSRYKGVSHNKRQHDWECYISLNRKRMFIGRYKEEWKAGIAYNNMARKLFGEFAKLNRVTIPIGWVYGSNSIAENQ